jgi:hypothetical protein
MAPTDSEIICAIVWIIIAIGFFAFAIWKANRDPHMSEEWMDSWRTWKDKK